jgi:acetylornithine/N-succinyldiaminopimelate aminotransferase
MTSEELIRLDSASVMQTYGRFPVAIDHGEGATLYSPEGKKYIDFASGIGVNCLGYGNQKWLSAITEQAGKLAHISNLYYSEPYIRLAAKLTERTGMKRAFFANGGGEANEGMIKLCRKYSYDKYGKGRSTIITLKDSFHGRTITTLTATGQEVFHQYFFPFTEGFQYAEANNLDSVKALDDGTVCAVMVELVQGEGGVLPLDQEFVTALSQLCQEKDWLLAVDEVQTGVGRTGSLFCFQQYGILPDVMSFAKGIGGGLPLAGILAGEKTDTVLGPGTHATTFGGNPICCAGALSVLEQLDDTLLAGVQQKGQYLREKISALPAVDGVRGMGLMLGISLKEGKTCGDAVKALLENGLLCLTAGHNTIRLLPPLTISQEELDQGLAILAKVLGE